MVISAIALLAACKRDASTGAAGSASASSASSVAAIPAAPAADVIPLPAVPTGPVLGVRSFVTIVYKEPNVDAKRIGYLRVGAKVERAGDPIPKGGCKEGFYPIKPTGYVCGADVELDLESPILRAAERRPDLRAAMPYRYGFVRAVLPLYLKVPTKQEQEKSEFKLKEHLEWYGQNREEVDKVSLGAFDVPLDDRGVPIAGKAVGDLGQAKTSLEVGLGVLFGGQSEDDMAPAWLAEGRRAIPNISDFAVPEYAVFADRARRFSGLGLIGSFKTNDELGRRFAITTDLRLAPTTKLKPDSGSPWHGLEITDAVNVPFAFVREQGAVRYDDSGRSGEDLQHRGVVLLTGKQKRIGGERYLATRDGSFVRRSDVGLVMAPAVFPKVAEAGEKWIEVSLGDQTLTLWEGKKPVYATLVSTGRKEYPTVTGEFRIKNKHITATMDSNESSDVGGGAPKEVQRVAKADPGPKKKKDAKSDKGAKGGTSKASAPAAAPAAIPRKGDGEYGVTKRRGEGTYQLRDVPYIQYFAAGYALHAAYWHDVFGKSRSHGCVNLAPIDAHRVFMWSEPRVPDNWHAMNTGDAFGEGTTVIVHE